MKTVTVVIEFPDAESEAKFISENINNIIGITKGDAMKFIEEKNLELQFFNWHTNEHEN